MVAKADGATDAIFALSKGDKVYTFKAKDDEESVKWLRAFMAEGSSGPSLPAETKGTDTADRKKTGKRMAVSAEAGESSSTDYVKQYYKKTDEARAFIFDSKAASIQHVISPFSVW